MRARPAITIGIAFVLFGLAGGSPVGAAERGQHRAEPQAAHQRERAERGLNDFDRRFGTLDRYDYDRFGRFHRFDRFDRSGRFDRRGFHRGYQFDPGFDYHDRFYDRYPHRFDRRFYHRNHVYPDRFYGPNRYYSPYRYYRGFGW